MLENANIWAEATSELLRALRGRRSQVAFSRRLGYASNVAADWESGRRAPTAEVLLHAMERVGIDVPAGFRAFHPASADALADGLPAWLEASRGQAAQREVAERSGFSRHQIRRWLSGEGKPRVPEFLRLVQALTGRAPDWVASFVDIERVPSLAARHNAARAAARLAYDHPWSAAIRMLIDSDAYRADPTDVFLEASLGIGPEALRIAVGALLDAGLAARRDGALVPLSTFTADARASAEDHRRLKKHWSEVAAARLDAPREGDLVSLNLATLSKADLERARQLQRAYFRELRSLVASSEPEQVAALFLMQTIVLTKEPRGAATAAAPPARRPG